MTVNPEVTVSPEIVTGQIENCPEIDNPVRTTLGHADSQRESDGLEGVEAEGVDEHGHDRPKPVTIADVAKEARVAASTVSRALNNPGRLNIRTEEHVQAVAQRLGYRPNPVARALGARRTETLGLLVPDVTNPFYFGVIRGAERQAASAGFTLVISDAQENPLHEAASIARLKGAVDGFILASSRMSQVELQQLASEHRITLVNRQVPGVSSVVVDPHAGVSQALSHLASLGHTRLTYIAGPRQSWSDARRWQELQALAPTMGMTLRRVGPFAPSRSAGSAAADAVLTTDSTAVLAFNDLLAIGALGRFAERGVSVPGRLSVVGFDNIFGADFCSPGLTTLASPMETVGRTAAQLLLDTTSHRPSANRNRAVVLPAQLVVRASTGSARASGGR